MSILHLSRPNWTQSLQSGVLEHTPRILTNNLRERLHSLIFGDFNNEANTPTLLLDVKIESGIKLPMIHVTVTSIKT